MPGPLGDGHLLCRTSCAAPSSWQLEEEARSKSSVAGAPDGGGRLRHAWPWFWRETQEELGETLDPAWQGRRRFVQ